jgi:hypothetical protein
MKILKEINNFSVIFNWTLKYKFLFKNIKKFFLRIITNTAYMDKKCSD